MTFTKKTLEDIDPALGFFSDFEKLNHGTSAHIMKMRNEAIFTNSVFPAKLKTLLAMLWGISARCEPCLKYYVLKAKELDVSETELCEVLAVASVMGGCVGETWALKAYSAFKSFEKSGTTDEKCC